MPHLFLTPSGVEGHGPGCQDPLYCGALGEPARLLLTLSLTGLLVSCLTEFPHLSSSVHMIGQSPFCLEGTARIYDQRGPRCRAAPAGSF